MPNQFLRWLLINPMQPVVAGYQTIFLERSMPAFASLTFPVLVALIALLAGAWVFWRHSDELVDEL